MKAPRTMLRKGAWRTRIRCRCPLVSARGPAVLGLLVLLLVPVPVSAYPVEYDAGPIEALSGDVIQIQGVKGLHVLEVMGYCPWCEVGTEILIRFKGYARAAIKPDYPEYRGIELNALIIKDGREE